MVIHETNVGKNEKRGGGGWCEGCYPETTDQTKLCGPGGGGGVVRQRLLTRACKLEGNVAASFKFIFMIWVNC